MKHNKYIGHPEQMAGAEFFRRDGGRADGAKVCRIRNGLGLECILSADRCADPVELSFCGVNLGFLSPCGHVKSNPALPFLETFSAGFLTTCGLNNVGSPNRDEGEDLPLHGTIANTPCHSIAARQTEEGIRIEAVVYDGRLFGRSLKLEREYFFPAGKNEMILTDRITNLSDSETPYELLYHCNMGYPFLDEDAVLKIPSERVTPRNDHAATGLSDWSRVESPQAGYEEMCFFHTLTGEAKVSMEQPKYGIGLRMEYDTESLPYFTEWKMMGERTYVLGLEPGNCHPDGRAKMRAEGALQILAKEETKEHKIRFVFYKTEA